MKNERKQTIGKKKYTSRAFREVVACSRHLLMFSVKKGGEQKGKRKQTFYVCTNSFCIHIRYRSMFSSQTGFRIYIKIFSYFRSTNLQLFKTFVSVSVSYSVSFFFVALVLSVDLSFGLCSCFSFVVSLYLDRGVCDIPFLLIDL